MLYPVTWVQTHLQTGGQLVIVQHFELQEVLQPLQLQLTLGTLMHLRKSLQTFLHTHFLIKPMRTDGRGVTSFSGYSNANLTNSFEVG